jgi:transposase-like protein
VYREDPRKAAGAPTAAPVSCPYCRSKELTTASKTVTSASYWRCLTCGEIWNVERLETGARYASRWR